MLKQYSPEVLALRERIKLGNDKLNAAWEQLRGMVHKTEVWDYWMEQWHQANERLSSLCTQLKAMGYEDCLYLNEKGKKIRSCLEQDGLGCRVCPSIIPYWNKELMTLPSPLARQSEKGAEQTKFIEKLGGKE